MGFDILGYKEKFKDHYGDASLEEVAQAVYDRTYKTKYPDFDSWKKSAGIETALVEDQKKRNPSILDRLREGTSHVAPRMDDENMVGSRIFPSMSVPSPAKKVLPQKFDLPTDQVDRFIQVGTGKSEIEQLGQDLGVTKTVLESDTSRTPEQVSSFNDQVKGYQAQIESFNKSLKEDPLLMPKQGSITPDAAKSDSWLFTRPDKR
jgi:hypothetical protein